MSSAGLFDLLSPIKRRDWFKVSAKEWILSANILADPDMIAIIVFIIVTKMFPNKAEVTDLFPCVLFGIEEIVS